MLHNFLGFDLANNHSLIVVQSDLERPVKAHPMKKITSCCNMQIEYCKDADM